jgi:hypothetical protein
MPQINYSIYFGTSQKVGLAILKAQDGKQKCGVAGVLRENSNPGPVHAKLALCPSLLLGGVKGAIHELRSLEEQVALNTPSSKPYGACFTQSLDVMYTLSAREIPKKN